MDRWLKTVTLALRGLGQFSAASAVFKLRLVNKPVYKAIGAVCAELHQLCE